MATSVVKDRLQWNVDDLHRLMLDHCFFLLKMLLQAHAISWSIVKNKRFAVLADLIGYVLQKK